MINSRGDAWPDARRGVTLLHCLGTEGQWLFYTLPEQGATYDEAMAALVKHFVPKVNALACKHTFRQHLQWTDKTVTQYVAALRALAAPCGFGPMENETVRDQLIANAYLSAVKEKLLLEEDLTLDKALTITCQVEAAVKNTTLLSPASAVPAATVQAVDAANSINSRLQHLFSGEKARNGNNANASDVAVTSTWLMTKTVQLQQ